PPTLIPRSSRTPICISAILHAQVAGYGFEITEPALYVGIAGQVEPAFLSHMRVGIEADVGDRRDVRDEETMLSQMLVHDRERLLSACLLAVILRFALLRQAQILVDISCCRNEGLMAVLLEELPLQHPRPGETLRRQKPGAVREIVQDGIRLPENLT